MPAEVALPSALLPSALLPRAGWERAITNPGAQHSSKDYSATKSRYSCIHGDGTQPLEAAGSDKAATRTTEAAGKLHTWDGRFYTARLAMATPGTAHTVHRPSSRMTHTAKAHSAADRTAPAVRPVTAPQQGWDTSGRTSPSHSPISSSPTRVPQPRTSPYIPPTDTSPDWGARSPNTPFMRAYSPQHDRARAGWVEQEEEAEDHEHEAGHGHGPSPSPYACSNNRLPAVRHGRSAAKGGAGGNQQHAGTLDHETLARIAPKPEAAYASMQPSSAPRSTTHRSGGSSGGGHQQAPHWTPSGRTPIPLTVPTSPKRSRASSQPSSHWRAQQQPGEGSGREAEEDAKVPMFPILRLMHMHTFNICQKTYARRRRGSIAKAVEDAAGVHL